MNKFESNSAVIVIYKSGKFNELDKALNGQLKGMCDANEFADKDEVDAELTYPTKVNVRTICVVKTKNDTPQERREFGGKYTTRYKNKVDHIYFELNFNDEDVYDGAMMSLYDFSKYKTAKERMPADVHTKSTGGLNDSITFSRDLVSEPGNVLYPAEYAKRINEQLSPLGVQVKIYHQSQLEEMGLNLLLSVGQGSAKDSYVVVMEWMNSGDAKEPPIAFVGKGVTFDTGGISLKPGRNMGDMKYDMGGSAAVVGAMHAVASKKLAKNVVGIVGLVENMPDGTAIKPGDVVTSLSGLTVENLNTDAEGRLVLADILAYIQNEYDPVCIIDLATLTGAIVATLGHEMAGLFTNSTTMSDTIIQAGKMSGEGFYRMPMGENWAKMIESPIADMQNIGGPYGGSTTAAEFLYKFVNKETAWAHLDIAGMCWESSGKSITPKGAAGFGVRTLFNFADMVPNAKKQKVYTVDEDMSY